MKKCHKCNKRFWLKQKILLNNKWYCELCHQQIQTKIYEEEKKEHEMLEKLAHLAKEKKKEKDLRAKKEIEQLKQKELKKKNIKQVRKNNYQKKQIITKVEATKKPNQKFKQFSKEEIKELTPLLLLDASIKRLKVIEFRKGKEKILLNKEREIRKSKAGGFSQMKFQKFVNFKKSKTFEWVISELEKPGILRPPYEKIKVNSSDEMLKANIDVYMRNYLK